MLAMGMPGTTEWFIILLIALLLFGSRLPGVMRSAGQSVRQFKKGLEDDDDALNASVKPSVSPEDDEDASEDAEDLPAPPQPPSA